MSILILVFLVSFMHPFEIIYSPIKKKTSGKTKIINYISQNTNKSDTLLVTGGNMWILVASNRNSATNFIYDYPVLQGFKDARLKYTNDVIKERPKYIISRGHHNKRTKKLKKLNNFINANYKYETKIGVYEFWKIK